MPVAAIQVKSLQGFQEDAKHAGALTVPIAGDSDRFHHLDALRAFALLAGVFYHAAESFRPNNWGWGAVDSSTSNLLGFLRFGCHGFRLELFFVLAGFFARLVIQRRGMAGFIHNRLQRILVPLVLGWILFYPLIAFVRLWGWAESGRLANFVGPSAQGLTPWQLTLNYFISGDFLRHFDFAHLWFLHQLLAIYILVLGARWLYTLLDSSGKKISRVDGGFAMFMRSRGAPIGFALPTAASLLLMNSWPVDIPRNSLIPHLPTTLLYGFCFLMGWLWYRQPSLMSLVARRWRWHLANAAFLWCAMALTMRGGGAPELRTPSHLAFSLIYAHMMWAFVLGFIGLFTQFLSRSNQWVRYLADASYWVYLAHLPLVLALQVLVMPLHLHWAIKFPLVCVLALLMLFLSYHCWVRGTFVGVQLNGCRKPLVWPWEGQDSTATSAVGPDNQSPGSANQNEGSSPQVAPQSSQAVNSLS